MKKLASIILTMVFALAFGSGAYALPVSSLFNNGTATLLSDNSAEFLIDVDGNNTIDVGDILVAMVGLNTIGSTTIGSGTIYNELTAITAIKIASGPTGVDTNFQGIDIGKYVGEALSAADSIYFDWSTGSILGGLYSFDVTGLSLSNDGTTFGIVYEDSAKDYDRNATIQDGIDSATGGIVRLILGLDDTANDIVTVRAPIDITDFSNVYLDDLEQVEDSSIFVDGSVLADFWNELEFNDNFTGGNGGFAMPEDDSEWPAYDNLDFTFTATVVPEPGTVVLLGVGLLGLGWTVRRR